MTPLNSDMMVGKSAFKQIQEKEINSKYPLLEKNIPKLFNAGHFDHFLSFLTLAPALCPTGSSRIQTDCRSTAGLCSTPSMSWYLISIFSKLQYFIISIFRHFNNFRIQPIGNLITGFAQLHRLPLPSLADVDSNPLPRHHLPRLRHQR